MYDCGCLLTADGERRTHWLAAAFALAALACLSTHPAFAVQKQNLLNKPAPQFALNTLDGQPLELAHFRGKLVLLSFWATWCAPCQVEMPIFSAWQRQYGPQGLQVIGISMDDDAALARRAVERLKLNYPVAMGNARLGARYGGVLGLPLTFLIDRRGIIRARFQGETNPHTIEKEVQSLLAQTR